ncbi:hypothetical protein EDF67_102520 [Sphingobacterium sp. JUb78]|nr:hypothetical protein [Sphingobacterium kitahiroshimense]TCR13106.1 hypothetical protein EDF67_102520 [Sphingobacterium sp. JUb78]
MVRKMLFLDFLMTKWFVGKKKMTELFQGRLFFS